MRLSARRRVTPGVEAPGWCTTVIGCPWLNVFKRTPQNLAAFQVVRHGAVAEVDAVMVEQAVLARHLQMVSGGHGGIRRFFVGPCLVKATLCRRCVVPPSPASR